MNFQQLRIIRETLRCDFNLTQVAQALATSQSGVSKHIKDLEDELGVQLFIRKGKRLLGMTEPGREIARYAERMLVDAGNIKRVSEEMESVDKGELVIATTHTQARYVLPPVISKFRQTYPDVHLVLHQTSPQEIARLLLEGKADIGIATEAVAEHPDIAAFPYHRWRHTVIAPKGHPLEKIATITLKDVAKYPIITYHDGFTGRPKIDAAFAAADTAPDIVMAALDADVIKVYVDLGLGVGIVAVMAVDAARDTGISVLETSHLFAENVSYIAVRRDRFMRQFAYRFIEASRPDLTEQRVKKECAASE